jgi:hypothetical protein
MQRSVANEHMSECSSRWLALDGASRAREMQLA